MKASPEFDVALLGYSAAISKMVDDKFAEGGYAEARVLLDEGPKYVRVVIAEFRKRDGRVDSKASSRRVHSFVNKENGDILKAAGWKAPAKHARGNIYEADYGIKSSGASWVGVRYL